MLPTVSPVVTRTDPPLIYSNMRLTVMDSVGRLLEFRTVPLQLSDRDAEAARSEAADSPPWKALFDAAGLDMTAFTTVASRWTPPVYADTRLSWEGPAPGYRDRLFRIEAASLHGKPVYFLVVGPWTYPDAHAPRRLGTADTWIIAAVAVVLIAFIVTAIVLARRHLLAGRADVAGATRLAIYLGVPMLVAWALRAHHVSARIVSSGASSAPRRRSCSRPSSCG